MIDFEYFAELDQWSNGTTLILGEDMPDELKP
jgi:hypothetical protein